MKVEMLITFIIPYVSLKQLNGAEGGPKILALFLHWYRVVSSPAFLPREEEDYEAFVNAFSQHLLFPTMAL